MSRLVLIFSALALVCAPAFLAAQDAAQTEPPEGQTGDQAQMESQSQAGEQAPETAQVDVPEEQMIGGNKARISNLAGLEIQTPEGQAAGTIEDAVVGQDGTVSSIIANVEQAAGEIQPGRYMIPTNVFSLEGDVASLDVQQAMQNAQMIEGELQTQLGQNERLASEFIGLDVQGAEGETIGSIEDMVADLSNGEISYVALSAGGVLGVGDKLLAVPFDQVSIEQDMVSVDVSSQQIEQAEGFSRDSWPQEANTDWLQQGTAAADQQQETLGAEQQPQDQQQQQQ